LRMSVVMAVLPLFVSRSSGQNLSGKVLLCNISIDHAYGFGCHELPFPGCLQF
jgi:hypothetical protein